LFAGAAMSGLAVSAAGSVTAQTKGKAPAGLAPTLPSEVQEALELQFADPQALLQHAGELEMLTARLPDPSLAPLFEQILDSGLDMRPSQADLDHVDTALACAVRALRRLDRDDAVAARRRAIMARPDLGQTREAAERIFERR
jgi:hypothetical protein